MTGESATGGCNRAPPQSLFVSSLCTFGRFGAARQALLAGMLLALASGIQVCADEGGNPFWVSGQYANRAALPPPTGWSLPVQLYYYSGKAPSSAKPSSAVTPGTQSRSIELSLTPTYEPETRVLGGELAILMSVPYGVSTFRDDSTAPPTHQSETGFGDLGPGASLNWDNGANNWLIYLAGNVPLGTYHSRRMSYVGIGHSAIDAGAGYTYYSGEVDLSWSTVVGFTYNFENPTTNYRNGIDSHLGWGLMKSISDKWGGGIAGYFYYQLSDDSSSGNTCGPCRSRVAAVGPQAIYTFNVGAQEWSLDLRAYYEFWAQNRSEGVAAFVTLSIPLSAPAR
jgi:hypothetical protein